MDRNTDKVVVVTGAGGGVGEGDAKAFAAEGASVVIADLNGDGTRGVADEINATGATVAWSTTALPKVLV